MTADGLCSSPASDSGALATVPVRKPRVRRPGMKPWLPLRCEDGMAITVPDDWTDRLGALIELLRAEYGGTWSRENPVLIRAAEECRIQTWHSFTRRDLEGECVDWDEGDGTYYGVQGSGAKYITVLWCERNAYDLGERAEAVESNGGSDG